MELKDFVDLAHAIKNRNLMLTEMLSKELASLVTNPSLPYKEGYVEVVHNEESVYKRLSDGELFFSDMTPVYKSDEEKLTILKQQKIASSKTDLATYLESNPLSWTDGEYYSITAEKQAQLTSTLVCAQADGQPPEWNSTGGVCREWDAQELTALCSAIKNRVKALVKYQQEKELELLAAESQEELDAIVVDYDTVPVPQLPEADQ